MFDSKRNQLAAVFAVIILSTAACGNPHYGLAKHQVRNLRDWEAAGQPLVIEKKPQTATVLAFFFGLGSFHTNDIAQGILDLILWPISILWEPWIAPAAANKINYEATQQAWERSHRYRMTPQASVSLTPRTHAKTPEPTPWSGLRRGLVQGDVRALLGEPAERSVSTKSTIWFYPDINGGYVLFKDDRVHSWRVP